MKQTLLRTILFLGVCSSLGQPSIASAQFMAFLEEDIVGQPAPDFTLKALSGEAFNFTQARAGQRAIVFFWATWCPTCHGELKRLNADIAAYHKQKIKIFAVNLGNSPEEVREYVERNKLNALTFVLDEQSSLIDPFALIGVPSMFFIKEDGVVASLQHSLPDDLNSAFGGPLVKAEDMVKARDPQGQEKDRQASDKFLKYGIAVFLLLLVVFAPFLMIRRLDHIISLLKK